MPRIVHRDPGLPLVRSGFVRYRTDRQSAFE